jgi:phosphocarrier protein
MTAAEMSQKLKPRTRRMAIVNKRGLHARASARFVETVASFDAAIEVEKDGITVGGTSIMGLMMLAASPGCSITVHASGSEAEAALDALDALVSAGFGEES